MMVASLLECITLMRHPESTPYLSTLPATNGQHISSATTKSPYSKPTSHLYRIMTDESGRSQEPRLRLNHLNSSPLLQAPVPCNLLMCWLVTVVAYIGACNYICILLLYGKDRSSPTIPRASYHLVSQSHEL